MCRDDEEIVIGAIVAEYPIVGVATDQLPYSPEFEALAERVQKRVGIRLANHKVWKLITRARKRGVLPRLR